MSKGFLEEPRFFKFWLQETDWVLLSKIAKEESTSRAEILRRLIRKYRPDIERAR